MQKQKGMMIGIVFLSVALIASFSQAAGEQKMVFKAGPAGKGAHVEAVIKDAGQDQKEITIEFKGLKPNAVYTVWLVNMNPQMDMIGVGSGDYSFKSDDKGNGHYTATVSTAELRKWQMLEIVHHPDGDPKNMKKMGVVFKADLKSKAKKGKS